MEDTVSIILLLLYECNYFECISVLWLQGPSAPLDPSGRGSWAGWVCVSHQEATLAVAMVALGWSSLGTAEMCGVGVRWQLNLAIALDSPIWGKESLLFLHLCLARMMLAELYRALMEAVRSYSEVSDSYRWQQLSATEHRWCSCNILWFLFVRIWQPKTARTSATETSLTLPVIFNSAFLMTPGTMQPSIVLASFAIWVIPGTLSVLFWQLTYKLVMARSCWPSIAHLVPLSIFSQTVSDKPGLARGLPRHSTAAAQGARGYQNCATAFIAVFPAVCQRRCSRSLQTPLLRRCHHLSCMLVLRSSLKHVIPSLSNDDAPKL